MTDEQQQHTGGYQWEAGQALNLIRQARAADDADGQDLGWIRLAEALKNAAQSGAAAAFIGIHTAAERQRQADAKAIFDLLKGLHDGQTVLQTGFQSFGERLTQLQFDMTELSREVAHVSAELGRSREHRAQLQATQESHEREIKRLDEEVAALKEEVRELRGDASRREQ